ncbi:MAG TPA: NUDIX hydrolase [Tetragenococcus sp.]|nr:NUDIX hydrolase [Tetragenococcus sp.]
MDYLTIYKELLSIAQAGLQYGKDPFDQDRYQKLNDLALTLIADLGNEPREAIDSLFSQEIGYQTPKTDVRGWIYRNEKILLVQDRQSKEWSLPGGYADVGLTPRENVEKEVLEETGLKVRANELKAVFDTNLRKDIPQTFQYYKLVFNCVAIKGQFNANLETSQAQYFAIDDLPELSVKRTTKEQLKILLKQVDQTYFE